jgi:DNA repair protein RecN (Recombination protein N)
MLRFLSIARLAIIDSVELELRPGLTVLTGETGAGKSIIVGAVDLLLGGRASADLVRTGAESAQIQAVIEAPDGREVLVRRELTASGRSRAFIDGTLVTTAALRDAMAPLVDLHGQHDHQTLLDPASHLDLLDEFAALGAERRAVASAFEAWRQSRDALASCQMDERERAARLELAAFQLSEIDRVGPQPGEDEELAETRRVLANADRLHRLCQEAYDELYEGDGAVLERLGRVWKRVAELAALDRQFEAALATRDAVLPQLQDLAWQLRDRATHLDASPERLQQVEDRLAALERLKRRYGPTLQDVITRRAGLVAERETLSMSGERAAELEAEVARRRAHYLEVAGRLSDARRAAAPRLARRLEAELAELAMAAVRCEVRFEPAGLPEGRWLPSGVDAVELYLSANPGEALRPLARIASGGELSRVMLALKTLVSTDAPGKTLVFDEVDAGIGGRAADAVGARLRQLGERFQVLCITHLPQVAAYAHHHYCITKTVRHGRTITLVDALTPERRIHEIARMMGGSTASAKVLEGARELLASRAKGEQIAKGESESPRRRLAGHQEDRRKS